RRNLRENYFARVAVRFWLAAWLPWNTSSKRSGTVAFEIKKSSPSPLSLKKRRGVIRADLLNFGLKIIYLFFFCDYLRNLRENDFARVAVDFGCGFAVLEE
ncbi:hypothetical protein, partial [Caldithrix abyssi]